LKILYLAHRIPYPPNKGEKTRCFYELQYLSARHAIDLICFADNDREAEGKGALEKICRSVHVEILRPREGFARAAAHGWKGLPASILYYGSGKMHQAVEQALSKQDHDLIFVYCSSMAQFIPLPAPTRTMIDFVDADSSKWKQYATRVGFPKSWLYAREGRLLAAYEKRVAKDFDVSIVATLQESQDLGGGGCSPVEVVENGVTFSDAHSARTDGEDIRKLQPYALFVGTMDYRPNIDAVNYFGDEIFPLLRRTHPELRFLIVGRNPTAEVQRLADRPGIVVTGTVPDVQQYVTGAAVAVAPFRIAQGVQNKVLEALVAGVPVVLTTRPARAIGGAAAELLLVADSPEDFAAKVRTVLENPEFRRRAQMAAPSLRESLSWESRLQRLTELVESSGIVAGGVGQSLAPEVAVG